MVSGTETLGVIDFSIVHLRMAATGLGGLCAGVVIGFVVASFIYPFIDRSPSVTRSFSVLLSALLGHLTVGGVGGGIAASLIDVSSSVVCSSYFVGAFIGTVWGVAQFRAREESVMNRNSEAEARKDDAEWKKKQLDQLPKILERLGKLTKDQKTTVLEILKGTAISGEKESSLNEIVDTILDDGNEDD